MEKFLKKHYNAIVLISFIWIIILAVHCLTAWDEPLIKGIIKLVIVLPFCLPIHFITKAGIRPRFFFGGSRHRPMSGIEISYAVYFALNIGVALFLSLLSFLKGAPGESIAMIVLYVNIMSCPE